jgi:hypothetical protein
MNNFQAVYVVTYIENDEIQGVYTAENKDVVRKTMEKDFELSNFYERSRIETINLINISK